MNETEWSTRIARRTQRTAPSQILRFECSRQKYFFFLFVYRNCRPTFDPWYQVISGGGTEYKLMVQVRLIVLPTLT